MQIIQHLMSMVRPHGYRAQVADILPALFFPQNSGNDAHHVHVTLQMCRFMEAFWVLFTHSGTQMGKPDAIAEGFRHLNQIVIGPHAVGTGAESEAIGRGGHRVLEPLHIINGGDDTG